MAAAEAILAVGSALRSGTDSAMLYDSLAEMKVESRYHEVEGQANFYTRIAAASSALIGGMMVVSAVRLPFLLNFFTGVGMVYVAFNLVEPSRKRRLSRTPLWDMFKIAGKAVANRKIIWLVLVMAMMFSTGVIGLWSYYLYYTEIGLGIGWIGFLSAAFGMCAGFGAKYSHVLTRELGERWSLVGLLILGPGMIFLGLMPSMSMIPMIFLIGFVWGFSIPMLLRFLNDLVDSETRATVIAVSNMTGTIFLAILSPIFKRAAITYSLGTAYMILGAWFLLLTSFSLLQFMKSRSQPPSHRETV